MNYWLVKSEPGSYSWDQFLKDDGTNWSGIRNYAARLNLMAMKVGDEALFYHSNEGKDIVGIAKVTKEHYPDDSATDGKDWVMVDLAPVRALKKPVALETIKKDPKLDGIELVRLSRLSVSKVTKAEFDYILKLSEG